jgi:hypothetical protein
MPVVVLLAVVAVTAVLVFCCEAGPSPVKKEKNTFK